MSLLKMENLISDNKSTVSMQIKRNSNMYQPQSYII